MPSAANAKSEKPASSEATDNSPIRQIITIIEHKIRNLEKRKSKLTSYRDLQKAGKELNADQKVAVAKYDEVAQTLEFARDLSKQVTAIATSAEREAKKQAKKDAWVRYAADTSKIRDVLLILDCLTQMGNTEAREDFLSGTNGAAKLTEEDLKILDDLYPEVTPKHEQGEEGEVGFQVQVTRAAEHLYAIIDGKPKDVLGTTYAHIKEIVTAVHECGYFDKSFEVAVAETEENVISVEGELPETLEDNSEINVVPVYVPPTALPVPPAPAVVPAPAYPLRPIPPITLQEVEHAYFSQQYPQQRPISEVIGSQNFFFLQESEIDSPIGTPQPPPILNQASPPSQIPTQTFTNQHYVLPPQPHFAPHPDHATYQPVPIPGPMPPVPAHVSHHIPQPALQTIPQPTMPAVHQPPMEPLAPVEEKKAPTPVEDKNGDEWKETQSPEREETGDRKTQGQGDGQNRYRRFGGRGRPNGYRGRGSYQSRPNSDGYHNRGEYQGRTNKDGYQNRQYDNYQNRHSKDGYQTRGTNDGYYGNGDTGDNQESGRDRYNNEGQNYQGGFKSRGRGGQRGRPSPRGPRPQYTRRQENVE